MPQYILICRHPYLNKYELDNEYELVEESYYEIVYRQEEHTIPVSDANDDESALRWVEDHAKEEVCCRNKKVNPQPLKLVKVLKQW